VRRPLVDQVAAIRNQYPWGTRHMRLVSPRLARSIRAITVQFRRPFLAALTLAVLATSALIPATTHAWPLSEMDPGNQIGTYCPSCSPSGWTPVIASPNQYTGLRFYATGDLDLIRGEGQVSVWSSHTADASRPLLHAALRMNSNGNLEIFNSDPRDNGVYWSTGTAGHPGAKLLLQDDGDLVILYQGMQIWHSNTAFMPNDRLTVNQKLTTGQQLLSTNGNIRLLLQTDGNLVLYRLDTGAPLWASRTQGKPMTVVTMQNDGNFVGRGADSTVYWRTVTYGHPGANLVVQDDGNLVVIDTNGAPLWATNTHVN
jgi:outer membrane protein assembly factor BamB